MVLRLFQVDAFSDHPFAGNPAAVCLVDGPRDDRWMQQVAAEMNLSETAFPQRLGGSWRLRWFTPAAEVELCGHATLATAHVLWEEMLAGQDAPIAFDTLSGRLTARRVAGLVELDFPATPPGDTVVVDGVLAALGLAEAEVRRSRFDVLVVAEREAVVRNLRPDVGALRRVAARGVIVTAPGDGPKYDFVSRFFAPAVGVDEDPVTGSAHCCLAPYWAERLGRDRLTGYQASERGGVVKVRVAGDRVVLGGAAVTVMRGELLA